MYISPKNVTWRHLPHNCDINGVNTLWLLCNYSIWGICFHHICIQTLCGKMKHVIMNAGKNTNRVEQLRINLFFFTLYAEAKLLLLVGDVAAHCTKQSHSNGAHNTSNGSSLSHGVYEWTHRPILKDLTTKLANTIQNFLLIAWKLFNTIIPLLSSLESKSPPLFLSLLPPLLPPLPPVEIWTFQMALLLWHVPQCEDLSGSLSLSPLPLSGL